MDPFGAAHWNQLQTTLWFYSYSRVVVRLASDECPRQHGLDDDRDDPPGFDDDPDLIAEVVMPGGCIGKLRRSHHTDCSFDAAQEQVLDALGRGRLRASGRRNGEGSRERIPRDEWPGLRFYWGRPLPKMGCDLPPAVSCSRRHVGPCDRHSQVDVPYWTDLLFEREEVVVLRPDPIRGLLRTMTEPATLAEAVALLAREHRAAKEVWARLRRRHKGRFPAAIQQRIEDAGKEFVEMLREGEIAARGRFCDRGQGHG